MPRPSLPDDPNALASIIEAMIFASEEPVAPRTLLRLLYDDPAEKTTKGAIPQQATLFEESADGVNEENSETPDPESENVAVAPENLQRVEEDRPVEEMEIDEESEGRSSDEDSVGTTPDEHARETGSDEEVGETGVEDEAADVSSEEEGAGGSRERMGQKELRQVIEQLNEAYEEDGRSFRIVEIAGGFQFATIRDYGEFVGLLSRDRAKRRLSPAALETLSIIAYRQPVTKPEVEAIRGVNCDQVLVSLMERELITISGRADSVGRPLLYSTTDAFLRAFGLNSVSDLPKLRELEELMEDDTVVASRPGDIPPALAMELLDSSSHSTPEGEVEGEGDAEGEGEAEEIVDMSEEDDAVEYDSNPADEADKGPDELAVVVDIPDESR